MLWVAFGIGKITKESKKKNNKRGWTQLNDRDNQSYFIATDVESATNEVIKFHNKSVEDGSYYERHPEIKRPEAK